MFECICYHQKADKKSKCGTIYGTMLCAFVTVSFISVYTLLALYEVNSSESRSGRGLPVSYNFFYYPENVENNPTERPARSADFKNVTAVVPKSEAVMGHDYNKYYGERCSSGASEGVCYPSIDCVARRGHSDHWCPDQQLECCIFHHSCGDVSSERVTYFQSPDFPARSIGTLACDYDVIVRNDICAVRIDYESVNLGRKLGGVCDIDQIFILNSVDGPTTGQCGPLSGYSTTVAVAPSQKKPVKIALLIQNEAYYHWSIKVTQMRCTEIHNFRSPKMCGRKDLDSSGSGSTHYMEHFPNLFHLWHDVKWRKEMRRATWWSYPEPVFNTFYYGTTKRHLQQESSSLTLGFQERIVGGTDAIPHEFPWQVAIFLDDLFFCGGALINDQYVVTAAHCVMTRDTPLEDLVLQLGDHDLTTDNETVHVSRGVRALMFHSHFHPFLLSNDIALLQLDKPVAFSRRVRPVCLPQTGASYTGRRGTVVGWGITTFPMGVPSPTLQKLDVETMSNFQCSRLIEEPVGLGVICAAPAALQGTCFGDSGGPLTIEETDGSDVLIGVVSFGVTGCAVIPAFPDLYTRVSEYLKWIDINAIA